MSKTHFKLVLTLACAAITGLELAGVQGAAKAISAFAVTVFWIWDWHN